MKFEKRFLVKFFLTNLCLIIPVVVVSFFAASMIAGKIADMEKQASLYQLNDMLAGFASDYQNYSEESVLLSHRNELLKDKINGTSIETLEGIEFLGLKQFFDNHISNVFLYYGTDYVYSSVGISRDWVHFESVLGLRAESVERGLDAIRDRKDMITFLYKGDTDGYLMYTYYIERNAGSQVSVNFVIDFEQLKRMFNQLQEGQFYQLKAPDDSTVILGRDARGRMVVINKAQWEDIISTTDYIVIEDEIEELDFSARLYYKEKAFGMNQGMYQMQWINILLIVVGVLFSSMISWVLSKKRLDEILHLEHIARGEATLQLSTKSAYSRLQDIMTSKLSEVKELEKRVYEHASHAREQTACLIFHGLIHSGEEINIAFQELGFDKCPESFFVGVIRSQGLTKEQQLPKILRQCLSAYVVHEGEHIVAFLYELPSSDPHQMYRKQTAGEIRAQFHHMNMKKVRIGMSQVYTDSLKIDCAYSEAISVLEYVVSGTIKDFYGCWESAVQDTSFLLTEFSVLQKWAESLQEHDFESANKWFCRMLHECQNAEAGSEKEFAQVVMNILKRSLVKEESDNFTKMLGYIDENYYRSDLAYEEVAEAGGVSKTYVSKIFRTKLGMSYIEYLTSIRLDKACILLRTTDININDIVKLVGYENTSSFRRTFKGKYGISPADYRKQEQWKS